MVWAASVRLRANRADAEDVAQTVFMRAFQRFAELGSSPTAAGWLKTGTRNTCLNHLSRYRRRWRLFSELAPAGGEQDDAQHSPSLVAAGASAADEFERLERNQRLERALRELPDHQRVPLVLFHFEELTYQQIADALNVSLAKVKTDIHRGRDAL